MPTVRYADLDSPPFSLYAIEQKLIKAMWAELKEQKRELENLKSNSRVRSFLEK